jgi:hypothetical protein
VTLAVRRHCLTRSQRRGSYYYTAKCNGVARVAISERNTKSPAEQRQSHVDSNGCPIKKPWPMDQGF